MVPFLIVQRGYNMKGITLGSLLILAAFSSPADAKSRFSAYEGRDSIQEGRGGTKVTKNGIDYWAMGTPPRRYQIIGVITDKRALGCKMCGNAIGSPSVAEAAKKAGGDAVILLGEQDHAMGTMGTATATTNGNFTSGFGAYGAFGDRVATLVVVKYLPETEPQK